MLELIFCNTYVQYWLELQFKILFEYMYNCLMSFYDSCDTDV